jgi:hypothetical protein
MVADMKLPRVRFTVRRMMVLVAAGAVAFECVRTYRRLEYSRFQAAWLTRQIERETEQARQFREIGNRIEAEKRAGESLGLPPREGPAPWHRDAGKWERSRAYHLIWREALEDVMAHPWKGLPNPPGDPRTY